MGGGHPDGTVQAPVPAFSELPTQWRTIKSSQFAFRGQQFDCLNPLLMGAISLFAADYPRPAYLPNLFGMPTLINVGEWGEFRDALRNAWNKCANDAVAQRAPMVEANAGTVA